MTTRRNFLTLLSWTASLPVFSSFAAISRANADQVSDGGDAAVTYFRELGYSKSPPLNLITGDEFNGGVRYDDSSATEMPDGKSLVLQNCIRMDDIDTEDRESTFPYFHILVLNVNEPYPRGAVLTEILEYLVNQVKLEADRLVLVSTDVFIPYLPILSNFGIAEDQFISRNREEAVAAGDGSGYFAPPDHPHVDPFFTVAIHYAKSPGARQQDLAYPLSGFIELGEVMIHEDAPDIVDRQLGGMGLERVLMAQGVTVPSFDESLKNAEAALTEEAKRRNVPLPPAYNKLKSV